ncbi:MAG: hypothetical protein AAGD07_00315 [Planctomycetota bacterium]
MREDLIGYLLGALEPHEMRRVQEWLVDNPEGQAELEHLEMLLRPLETREADPPPPSDLVSKTLANLPPLPAMDAAQVPGSPQTLASDREDATFVSLSAATDRVGQRNSSWRDWFASLVAAAVVLAILVPTVAEGRFLARREACQDRLTELGTALTQYVTRNEQSRLPSLDSQGPRAFAGVYAPRLHNMGLLQSVSQTHCPSVDPAAFASRHGFQVGDDAAELITLAMLDEVAGRIRNHLSLDDTHQAINQLQLYQRVAGGHFTYSLGVSDGGSHASPRYQARSHFAVMSDIAPVQLRAADEPTRIPSTPSRRPLAHDGRGINVLYEDGRVQFLPVSDLPWLPDHPLWNHLGRPEAGVNVDDASLAPSWQPPFVRSRQR